MLFWNCPLRGQIFLLSTTIVLSISLDWTVPLKYRYIYKDCSFPLSLLWDYPAKGKFTHCVHLQNNQLCHRYCQTLPIKRPAFPRKLTISWDCPIKDGGMSLGSRQHKEPSCMQSWIEYILSLRWDSYFHRILPLLEMRFLVTQNTSSPWDEILSYTEYILSLRWDS